MNSLGMEVEECCQHLRRRQLEGSYACARATARILRTLITKERHADAASLIEDVKAIGTKLQAANSIELAIGNIVRRVLHMIREEQQQDMDTPDEEVTSTAAALTQQPSGLLSQALRARPNMGRAVSLSNLLDQGLVDDALDKPRRPSPLARPPGMPAAPAAGQQQQQQQGPSSSEGADAGPRHHKLTSPGAGVRVKAVQWNGKHNVIEVLNELIDELDGIEAQIALQAVEHIHANEVILTYGCSNTTHRFLKEAHKRRHFQVVVAEAAPRYDGQSMARQLAEAGVQTTLIADSAVFAMMARANKVLVGAHAVLANGGIIAPSGIHMVALAAKRHSIPFVVLVGLHKLSPLFPHDPDVAFNDFKSPAAVADFDVQAEAFIRQDDSSSDALNVEVVNPAYDYIRPELISLFVTDTGGYTPSYVYRLLSEYYSREDYVLSPELLDMVGG